VSLRLLYLIFIRDCGWLVLLGRCRSPGQDRWPSSGTPQAAEYLISAKMIRPGVVILAKMVASARTGARALTWEKVVHLLTRQVREDLDRLLMADAGLAVTRLAWLTTPTVDATAAAVKTSIEKLAYLRNMDAHRLDLSMLPVERPGPSAPKCSRPGAILPDQHLCAGAHQLSRCT
jgi:hypothetical protein